MAGLQLSGLASGLDWKTLVENLVELESAPITRMTSEKTANTSKFNALTSVGTRLTDLRAAVTALQSDTLFTSRTATLSGTGWSASAGTSATAGNYAIAVSQLATAARRTSTSDIGSGIATTSDVSGVTIADLPSASGVTAGVFTVNGAQVSVALTDSLEDVLNRISTATGGAVTAAYNPASDKLELSSGSTITLGAANDTSNFLSATRLHNNGTGAISSGTALGTTDPSATLVNARLKNALTAVDGSGNGSFQINGVTIAYNVNSDSLSGVLSRINSSTAGVSAAYDSSSDRVIFTNKSTGDVGMAVTEAAGGLLSALGVADSGAFSRGDNAQFTINGGAPLTSTSNTLTSSAHGITGLSVTVNSESTQSVDIAADTTAMRGAIDTFLTKFNAFQSYIDEQTKITSANGKVTTAQLASNREVQAWASSMRSLAFSAGSGVGGVFSRLESLGIDYTRGTSQLAVKDSAKLDSVLRNQGDEVAAFFQTNSTGFASKFDAALDTMIGASDTSGALGSQKTNLTNANSSLDKQIADFERYIETRRAQLQASFIAMETAQARIQNMQSALTNAFSTSSSSK